MALLGPDDSDKRKLHSEITQVVNQRFVCSLTAVTAFGVIAGWMASGDGADDPWTFIVSSFLMFLLFALFLLSHSLRGKIRVLTAYLCVMKASGWEQDWSAYREKFPGYWGYTKPQTTLFIFLGGLSALFPFILGMIRDLKTSMELGFAVALTLFSCIAYMAFTIGMGFRGWFDRERDAKQNWQSLK